MVVSEVKKGSFNMKRHILIFILILSLAFAPACTLQTVVTANADEAETYNDTSTDDSITTYPDFTPPRGGWRSIINVTIDGRDVQFPYQNPVIVDGRTLVPVRGVFEHMGFDVDWNPASMQAILTNDDYEVILTIGSAEFTTNGVVHTLDVPAQIINDKTMLPIRAVLESVGYYVSWDRRLRIVLVSSTPITYVTIREEQFSTALRYLHFEFDFDLTNEDLELVAKLTSLAVLTLPGGVRTDEVNGVVEVTVMGQISDITPLAELTDLVNLTLGGNQISDIAPLATLTNLTFLNLCTNKISDLSPLVSLTNLDSLGLDNNLISDLSPLAKLPNLGFVSLHSNPITDWSPVAHIETVQGRP